MAAKSTNKRKTSTTSKNEIASSLIDAVCDRLARNLRVRRTLYAKGRLHVDRQLPFLCIYRQPPDHDDAGTERLVKGEASYLVVSAAADFHKSVANLVAKLWRRCRANSGRS